MKEGKELEEMLLSKGPSESKATTIDAKWLSDLFQPDNVKKLESNKRLSEINGYAGIENLLRTNLKSGLPGTMGDKEWRSQKFGSNDPIVKPPKSFVDMVLQCFEDETIKILCAAAILSLVLGILMHGIKEGWLEGVSIILAVVIISAVTAGNDYMKEKQFRKLNEVATRKNVNVLRNGQIVNMNVYDLLVGDIVQVETGEIISVDGLVFKASRISMDESSVTGESDQVKKEDYESGKKCNPYLISGSKVMEGTGFMIVLAVGLNSQEGKNKAILQKDADDTPLQEKLAVLADQIGRLGIASASITFAALLIHLIIDTVQLDRCVFCFETFNHVVNYFIIAVSIVVIAVPEGLPLAVTISLAYSVGKMKDENNLVRFLSACETMGGANNVCTDKTGTLTKNLMTVTKLWSEEAVHENFNENIKLSKATAEMMCKGLAVNSNAHPKIDSNKKFEQIGNKTECALLEMAFNMGFDFRKLREELHVIDTVPFSSSRKRMSAIARLKDGRRVIFTKGAPDFLLPSCSRFMDRNGEAQPIDNEFKGVLAHNLTDFATHSLRNILICYRVVNESEMTAGYNAEDLEKDLIILGLAGIKDPLKKGIPEAVNSCKIAGIIVRMVTGDNTETAVAIAKDANILPASFERPGRGEPGEYTVMEGQAFREQVQGLVQGEDEDKDYVKNMKEFEKIVRELRVLARSSPEDKYILATGLKQLGNVVAMTGDGSNDAPALKKADIGFAMGIAGTQVAKEAAGIILLDDNFSSIITAVKYGRNIFDCIRKFLQFQLTVNVVAIFMAFLGAAVLKESPLTPVQMLWVNLIMDTLAALALATEPPNEELLYRMPYSRNEKMITPQMWRSITFHSIFQIAILCVILFEGHNIFGVPSSIGVGLEDWNNTNGMHFTLFFDCFVFLQVFNFFNARKLKQDELNVFSNIGNNYLFILIVIGIFLCQLFITEFGGKAIQLVPLSATQHLVCIGIGALSLVSGVIIKKCIPEGVFNVIPLLSETDRMEIYDVDGELKKLMKQPASQRRSSKHRH